MALTPEQLKNIPENIVKLYRDLEEFIIDDIARRISKAGEVTAMKNWKIPLNKVL